MFGNKNKSNVFDFSDTMPSDEWFQNPQSRKPVLTSVEESNAAHELAKKLNQGTMAGRFSIFFK